MEQFYVKSNIHNQNQGQIKKSIDTNVCILNKGILNFERKIIKDTI